MSQQTINAIQEEGAMSTFSLTEIRELQLNCIKQLNGLIGTVKTMPYRGGQKGDGSCPKFVASCLEEIELRKMYFNHPELILAMLPKGD